MANQSNNGTDQPIIEEYLLKHVVPFAFVLTKGELRQEFITTAFVMSVNNIWFLVTAAHCFRIVNELLTNGYTLVSCRLFDSLGINRRYVDPIPFNYDPDHAYCLDEFEEGLDIGFYFISTYYRKIFEANNIEALDEKTWEKVPNNIDFYWLIGLPVELIKFSPDQYLVGPLRLLVIPQTEKPNGFPDRLSPRFYGEIHPESIESIKGMSGGPIFAFKSYSDKLRYWLVAVQSTWLPVSHYIEAVPIKFFGDNVKKELKKLIDEERMSLLPS